MKITETSLEGVKLIELDVFRDNRGAYIETYNKQLYKKNGVDIDFVQDDCSVSHEYVLRGIHGDYKTWKLIDCLEGEFMLVVVNCDKKDEDFGKWESFNFMGGDGVYDYSKLDYSNKFKQILIPPSYGNAHLCYKDNTIFHYKQSTYYNRESQFTYRFNEPEFLIKWGIGGANLILSERDKNAKFIRR